MTDLMLMTDMAGYLALYTVQTLAGRLLEVCPLLTPRSRRQEGED